MLDRAFGLCTMARPGRQLAIAHGTQFPAQRLPRQRDLEPVAQPLAQIDQPPAHHPVHRRDRAALDRRRQRRAMGVVQARWLAGGLAVDQTRL